MGTLLLAHTPSDRELLWNLKRYRSPLSDPGKKGAPLSLEQTLAFALGLSRKDPSVAHAWTVVFARNRNEVNLSALLRLATQLKRGRVLGFFLSVLRSFLGDEALEHYERQLHEDGVQVESFFLMKSNKFQRALMEKNTPSVALEWGFQMNTSLEDFFHFLEKFLSHDRHVYQ